MLNKGNAQLSKDASLPQARTTDLVTREMPDEILVYDLKRHKAHCLNQTAMLVWKQCDGKQSVSEIATLIGEDLNATVDEAAVWLAVEQLGKANLLENRVMRSASTPRLSRREAVRKLGLGAALAMPVVVSIIAPTAVSAATCVITGAIGACKSTKDNNCCSGCCNAGKDANNACLATGLGTGNTCSQDCQCTLSSKNRCSMNACE
jgi:hypothetical protein